MSYTINSIQGILTGSIPVYEMNVKYMTSTTGEWSGNVNTTSYEVDITLNNSTNRIAGCAYGYNHAIAGSGVIDNSDYQLLMKELESVGGVGITADFYNLKSSAIIFQIEFDSGFLTFLKDYNPTYNSIYYYVVASDFSDMSTLIDAVRKNGRGYQNCRIMGGNFLAKNMTCFFFKENYLRQNKSVLRFGAVYNWNDTEYLVWNDSFISMPFDQNISDLYIGDYTLDEKDDTYGPISTGGGYGGGSFDGSSDGMGLPTLPAIGVSDSGMINVYHVSKGQLDGFASDLFPDFTFPEPSTKDGLEAVAENLANTVSVIGDFANSYINAGLVNYVIDCHVVPVAPASASNSGIKVGFKTFDYNPNKVTSDYVEIDCGILQIKEYYQNFLDYIGTRAKLYLPFIGFVDIKPEWFQSGKLQVIYHFNVIDGSCIAFILATSSKSTIKDTVVATFGGNACVHIPITGVNYASMISGVVGSIGNITSAVANKDIGGAFTGVTDLLSAKPTLEQSNGYNAGMSFMSYRTPYLLIERPVASFSKNYPHEKGLPLNVTKRLGTLKGFTVASNANLDGILCNSEEKDMIQTALAEGIIL